MRAARTIEEITARICRILAEFHRRGDVSIVTLLTESGYQAVNRPLTIKGQEPPARVHSQSSRLRVFLPTRFTRSA